MEFHNARMKFAAPVAHETQLRNAEGLREPMAGGAGLPTSRWMVPGLVLAGIICRIVQYLWDRSFWVDEASLVLNIRHKTAAELLGKLDYHQAAPPLFLLAERGMYRLLGGSELSLRLLPLLAGCAAVVLFAVLARRMLTPWAAVVALALFCFSDRLIWHATETKQYGIDVLAAVVLTTIALGRGGADQPRGLPRNLIALCGAAALAVWCSYPAVLVFAGCSLALLPGMIRRGIRGWLYYFACNLIVLISFAALMWVIHAQQSQSLAEYWAEDFVPLRRPLVIPQWLGRHLFSMCNYAAEPLGFLTLPCTVLGAVWMARRGELRHMALLLNPIGMNLLAASVGRYPFDGSRVTVYLAPAVLLLSGAGAMAIVEWATDSARKLAVIPPAALALISAGGAAFHLVAPRDRGHIRPAIAFVREHAGKDDAIYALLYREFQCYWPEDDRRVWTDLPAADQIPSRRFWIVWSFPNARVLHRLDGTLKWAESFATRRLSYVGHGGSAYLFEITEPAPHAPPPDMSTHHKMMTQSDE